MLDKRALAVKDLFAKYNHPVFGDMYTRQTFSFLWQTPKAQWSNIDKAHWMGLLQYAKSLMADGVTIVSTADLLFAVREFGFSEELQSLMTKDYSRLFDV